MCTCVSCICGDAGVSCILGSGSLHPPPTTRTIVLWKEMFEISPPMPNREDNLIASPAAYSTRIGWSHKMTVHPFYRNVIGC